MHNVKVFGLVGFVSTLGITALVGCGGGGSSSPSLALSDANMKTVAGESLVDGQGFANFNIGGDLTAFAPTAVHGLRQALARVTHAVGAAPVDNATTTTPCDGGGTTTIDGADPTAGAVTGKETITFAACVQGDTTTDGSIQITGSQSGTSLVLTSSVSLTVKSTAATVVENGAVTITLNSGNLDEAHITADQISVSITSASFNDKITLSNLDITSTTSTTGDASATESYNVETTQLGGLVSLDTDTAVATASLSLHPHAGQVTITGAKSSKLVVTILGDETFTPPAGQGQVKLELDSGTGSLAAAVYVSWADLEAAAGGGAGVASL